MVVGRKLCRSWQVELAGALRFVHVKVRGMNPGKLFTTVEATMDLKPLMCPVPFPESMPFSIASEV